MSIVLIVWQFLMLSKIRKDGKKAAFGKEKIYSVIVGRFWFFRLRISYVLLFYK